MNRSLPLRLGVTTIHQHPENGEPPRKPDQPAQPPQKEQHPSQPTRRQSPQQPSGR